MTYKNSNAISIVACSNFSCPVYYVSPTNLSPGAIKPSDKGKYGLCECGWEFNAMLVYLDAEVGLIVKEKTLRKRLPTGEYEKQKQ